MKIPLAALAAVTLFAAPCLALAAKWERVGDTGKVSVWVDKESLRRTGVEARAWLEWRWAQPTELRDSSPPRTYRLERQMQVANCENRGYAVPEGTQYADERGTDVVGSYKLDETSMPYSVAPKRTIRDLVVSYVCSATPPKKS
ncbi:MAG: surface-adhesin E family protein [Caldimonas sp.]